MKNNLADVTADYFQKLIEVGCQLCSIFNMWIEKAQVRYGGIITLTSNSCLKHFFACKEELRENEADVGKIDYLLEFDCCNELLTLSRTCRKCQYCKSMDTVLIHTANYNVAFYIALGCLSYVKYPWGHLGALYRQRVYYQDYKLDFIANREKIPSNCPPHPQTKYQEKKGGWGVGIHRNKS